MGVFGMVENADCGLGLRTRTADSDCGLGLRLRTADCGKIKVRPAQLCFD